MNRQHRMILAGVLAVVSAVLTIFLLRSASSANSLAVVVAARDLQPFTLVKEEDLRTVKIDAKTAATLFPATYQETKPLLGRITIRRIRKNEVILKEEPMLVTQSNLDQSARGLPLSALVPEGYRAMTLQSVQAGAATGDFIYLYSATADSVSPVLGKPLLVVSERSGSLVVLVSDPDVTTLLEAQTKGGLYAVLAPPSTESLAAGR